MNNKVIEIVTKLRLAALGVLPRDIVLKGVMMEYSVKIAKAIRPITIETAPIIDAILREYAEEVEEIGPRVKEVADELMKLPKAVIRTEMKENGKA